MADADLSEAIQQAAAGPERLSVDDNGGQADGMVKQSCPSMSRTGTDSTSPSI